jgi:tRNA (uracil-5-)-methyltransferase
LIEIGQYPGLWQKKCDALEQRFTSITGCTAERFPSPPRAFRFRAEFSVWHEDGKISYAMHEPGKRGQRIPISDFRIGSELMQQLMPLLLEHLQPSPLLREKLFEIEFLTSRSGAALVSLIYHKILDLHWQNAAQQLKQTLRQVFPQLHLIGRSRGQKISLDQDHIEESFVVAGVDYHYRQIEGSFTQPNAFINEKMLNWAASATKSIGGDLLELYCGNGNFTLPLSRHFSKVLATEVSGTSIAALEHNLQANGIDNIAIARLSGEETAQALQRLRPFRRLQHLDLGHYRFSSVLVDPPRAGLDQQTLEFIRRFDYICYISCNPDTLLDNLQYLHTTHHMKQLAFFDQFPYTHHMECGVLLSRTVSEAKPL